MSFQLNVDSVAAIAQAVTKIITIFCACTRSIYGSGVNPRNIDLIRVGNKVLHNYNSMVSLKEVDAMQFE